MLDQRGNPGAPAPSVHVCLWTASAAIKWCTSLGCSFVDEPVLAQHTCRSAKCSTSTSASVDWKPTNATNTGSNRLAPALSGAGGCGSASTTTAPAHASDGGSSTSRGPGHAAIGWLRDADGSRQPATRHENVREARAGGNNCKHETSKADTTTRVVGLMWWTGTSSAPVAQQQTHKHVSQACP